MLELRQQTLYHFAKNMPIRHLLDYRARRGAIDDLDRDKLPCFIFTMLTIA